MTIEELIKTEGREVEFKLEMPQKDISFLKTTVAFVSSFSEARDGQDNVGDSR